MRDLIEPAVFEAFPGFMRGIVVARGVDKRGAATQEARGDRWKTGPAELLARAVDAVRCDAALAEPATHPRIAAWREAFSRFGARPSKFYSSVEALVRRARKDEVPFVNPLVALFNYISLTYLVPCGGDDLARVVGDLRLTVARGTEPFTPLNGTTVEFPEPGEVIFVDDEQVLCRRWNWRQGNQTRLGPDTTDVAINVDGLPPVTRAEVEEATARLAALVAEHCGGTVTWRILDEFRPWIALD